MSDKTKIEWTDATWNPITGCTQVSPGCDHCYALTLAERFRGTPGHHFERGFDVTLRPDKLDQPLRWRRPRKVFVNSVSDLFHSEIPDEYIARVFAVMALAPRHTFQVLTKRHGRMRALLTSWDFRCLVHDAVTELGGSERDEVWPLPNAWLGVSVEDQKRAELRVPSLLSTPAAVRFLSCEPLLGPVSLTHMDVERHTEGMYVINALTGANKDMGRPCADVNKVDWVIVGGESGHGARPMHIDWARKLRRQCVAARIAFHFKQWGDASAWRDKQGDVWHQRDDGLLESFETSLFARDRVEQKWGPLVQLGKAAAGRDLDGRTWDEYPAAAEKGAES